MGFFDNFARGEGGGGGYVAQVVVRAGFKSFQKGLSRNDSFFGTETPEDLESLSGNELQEAWEQSAEEARARAVDTDPEAANNRVFRLTIFKDTVLNKDMSDVWPAGDNHYDIVAWQQASTGVFMPSLNEIGFDPERETNQRFWAQVSFKEDPFQVDRGDEDPDLVPFIAQRFDSKKEAQEFAATLGGGDTARQNGVAPPENWNSEEAGGSWNEYVEATVSMLSEQLGEDPTPIQHTQAINSVHDALGGLVPKDKIREISENTDLSIPF